MKILCLPYSLKDSVEGFCVNAKTKCRQAGELFDKPVQFHAFNDGLADTSYGSDKQAC